MDTKFVDLDEYIQKKILWYTVKIYQKNHNIEKKVHTIIERCRKFGHYVQIITSKLQSMI
jgi:hypothetical protein